MAKANLLILLLIREALGNVIIEAAFQETPTIATRVDGIPEVIKNGETGILITPKDKIYNHPPVQQVVNIETEQLQKPLSPSVESIVNSVEQLMFNESKLKQMRVNASLYVTQKFSMDRYYKEIIQITEYLI